MDSTVLNALSIELGMVGTRQSTLSRCPIRWNLAAACALSPGVHDSCGKMTRDADVNVRAVEHALIWPMNTRHPLVSLTYHVEMESNAEKKILSFRLVKDMPNDVNSIRGYWRLFPQKGGRTLIAYVVAVKVPMGLVNLAGPDLERRSVTALLSIPGDMKNWVEGPNGKKYR